LPLTAIENAPLFAALIETVDFAGVPSVAPDAAESATLKLLPPAPLFRIGTANVLELLSPAGQLKLPDVLVKSVPATADPAAVA
jgi:hypothetical protein